MKKLSLFTLYNGNQGKKVYLFVKSHCHPQVKDDSNRTIK